MCGFCILVVMVIVLVLASRENVLLSVPDIKHTLIVPPQFDTMYNELSLKSAHATATKHGHPNLVRANDIPETPCWNLALCPIFEFSIFSN